jgi:hypothetical protein
MAGRQQTQKKIEFRAVSEGLGFFALLGLFVAINPAAVS